MNKKIIIGVILGLVTNLFFAGGLKKGVSVSESRKPEGAHGVVTQKASLQACRPNSSKLSEDKIRSLTESAENGDGYACWRLAIYFYQNDKMEEYIKYIKMGCKFSDPDCLFEIIDNPKKQIPCTPKEKSYYCEQLRLLGKNGDKKAYGYWNLLDLDEE